MSDCHEIERLLRNLDRRDLAPVVPFDLTSDEATVLDLSAANAELRQVDVADSAAFTRWVFETLRRRRARVGVGRYDEDRVIYGPSPLFAGDGERRSIHMGVDLFVEAGTPVSAPLEGTVHSLADNRAVGDYGPTVILQHRLAGRRFFSLYGHLSRDSVAALEPGIRLGAGARIGRVGEVHENGGWPPHLHLQLIVDLGDHRGDYPGVAPPSQRESFRQRCPDPGLILGLEQAGG